MEEDKKLTFKDMFQSLLDDHMGREEIISFFENVVNKVEKFETRVSEEVSSLMETLKSRFDEFVSDLTSKFEVLKTDINTTLDAQVRKVDARLAEVRDGIDGIDGENGVDGKDGKDGSPDTPADVVKKLESLRDEDRLDVSAIRGLEEFVKTLIPKQTDRRMGGAIGPSVIQHFLYNQTPSGTLNGINTDFTLPKAPKQNTERVFLNGVRMRSGSSNDYTLSGKTITFTSAPQSGDIILVDFEY